MKFEFFIANRLKTGVVDGNNKSSTPSLRVAVFGMTLAIAIMILSITIVCGFKREISNKIYALDSHIKIRTYTYQGANETSLTNEPIIGILKNIEQNNISSIGLIAEKSSILKTPTDFKGIIYKGVDLQYNFDFLEKSIVEGRVPNINDSTAISEVIVSKYIANKLQLSVGDKIPAYFIDNKVKVRNVHIVGFYNTDLEDFDKTYIIGNIRQLQSVNGWRENEGDYIGVNCVDTDNLESVAEGITQTLASVIPEQRFHVTTTTGNNAAYFTWLNLLDMNVVIIILIMLIVSAFTLISGMLMIVLERVNMIGTLKTLGTSNRSIRNIFILLTNKLILKSLLYGNLIGIGVSIIQQQFHIVKLNAETYYMPYVPIEINWWWILLLNVGIIVISYLSLLTPSHIVSTIEPNKSIKFE